MLTPTSGAARQVLSANTAAAMEASKTLIHDDRRLRSFYFDGRFLTAKDLTRDQTYFLTRQADLSRAGGTGVVTGLQVQLALDKRTLIIRSGHGITPGGELVVIPRDLSNVRMDDIPEVQRLDAAFGLSPIPRDLARNRSGLFIVALRPVEYTANPIASYPTTLGAARTVHDGDIIEAVAITLIPYPDPVGGGTYSARRSRVAHEIFAGAGMKRVPVDALPLAMVALDHGEPQWLDDYLVRREVGSEQTDFLGFGYAPRALREAYLQQYETHLQDVLAERRRGGKSLRFNASEHFYSLPPAGRLPVAAIDTAALTEFFFPPEIDVELTIVPDDELGTLLEESLLLPPIDLTLKGESLDSISVLVMVPVPRHRVPERLAKLNPLLRTLPVKLRASAEGSVARRLPGDALQALTARWTGQAVDLTTTTVDPFDATWRELLAGSTYVWFARRRNLPQKPAITGQAVIEPDNVDVGSPTLGVMIDMLRQAQLYDEFSSLPTRATSIAIGEIYSNLLANAADPTRWIFAGLAADLLRLERVEHSNVVTAIARYFQGFDGKADDGLKKLQTHSSLGQLQLYRIAQATVLPELGAYVMSLDAGQYITFTNGFDTYLKQGFGVDDAYRKARI